MRGNPLLILCRFAYSEAYRLVRGDLIMLDQNASILLVEDDRVDIMTVQRALKKIGTTNPLYVARTGLEALEMLRILGLTIPITVPGHLRFGPMVLAMQLLLRRP